MSTPAARRRGGRTKFVAWKTSTRPQSHLTGGGPPRDQDRRSRRAGTGRPTAGTPSGRASARARRPRSGEGGAAQVEVVPTGFRRERCEQGRDVAADPGARPQEGCASMPTRIVPGTVPPFPAVLAARWIRPYSQRRGRSGPARQLFSVPCAAGRRLRPRDQGSRLTSPMRSIATEVWQFRGLIGNFAQRELQVQVQGQRPRLAWSLINPLATLGDLHARLRVLPRGRRRRRWATAADRSSRCTCSPAWWCWNFFTGVVNGAMRRSSAPGRCCSKIYFPPFARSSPTWSPCCIQSVHRGRPAARRHDRSRQHLVDVPAAARSCCSLLALRARRRPGAGGAQHPLPRRQLPGRDRCCNLLFYATPIIYPIALVASRLRRAPVARHLRAEPDDRSSSRPSATSSTTCRPRADRLGYLRSSASSCSSAAGLLPAPVRDRRE